MNRSIKLTIVPIGKHDFSDRFIAINWSEGGARRLEPNEWFDHQIADREADYRLQSLLIGHQQK